eukprot:symbB.v1.2.025134.t1/scaffold2397.1/size108975/1
MPAAMSASQEATAKMKEQDEDRDHHPADSVETFLATNRTALEVLAQDLARKRPPVRPNRARLTPRDEDLAEEKENGATKNEGPPSEEASKKKKKEKRKIKKADSEGEAEPTVLTEEEEDSAEPLDQDEGYVQTEEAEDSVDGKETTAKKKKASTRGTNTSNKTKSKETTAKKKKASTRGDTNTSNKTKSK